MSKGLLFIFLAATVALTTAVFITRRNAIQRNGNVIQHAESKETVIGKAKNIINEIKKVTNKEALEVQIKAFKETLARVPSDREVEQLRISFESSTHKKRRYFRHFVEAEDILKKLSKTLADIRTIALQLKTVAPSDWEKLLKTNKLLLSELKKVNRHRDSEIPAIQAAIQKIDKELEGIFTSPFFTNDYTDLPGDKRRAKMLMETTKIAWQSFKKRDLIDALAEKHALIDDLTEQLAIKASNKAGSPNKVVVPNVVETRRHVTPSINTLNRAKVAGPIAVPSAGKKPLPFINFGSSCYFNSLLQCFFSNKTISDYLSKDVFRTQRDNVFVQSLVQIGLATSGNVESILRKTYNDAVATLPFLMGQRYSSSLYGQQDPGELAIDIIKELNRITQPISDDAMDLINCFPMGQRRTKIQCVNNHKSDGIDPFGVFEISLSIPTVRQKTLLGVLKWMTSPQPAVSVQVPTIQNLIAKEEAIVPLNLANHNQYECNPCGGVKVNAVQTVKIEPHQDLLIVRLKRAIAGGQKNQSCIKVETSMTIHGASYALTGMILHIGNTANSGHYIALVRDKENSDQWWLCNDMAISNGNTALATYKSGYRYGSYDVCMLFYEGETSGAAASGAGAGT